MDWIPPDPAPQKRWPLPHAMPLLLTALLLVVVLSTLGYGYFGLHWFDHKGGPALTQGATATSTALPSAAATSTTSPAAATSTTLPPTPTFTAVPPTATHAAAPTAVPQPQATATPAGPPPTLWVFQIVFAPKNCSQVSGGWSCSDTLGNTGSVNLNWTASTTMSGVSFSPAGGALAPGQQIQVLMVLPCVHTGTIYFTGPANQVTVSWGCYVNG